jgi:pimeloyl-ACP methyl ester carboxylesterase
MLHTFKLPSDRILTYREYGCPNGQPVFFFHGWPGEAQQASLIHQAALERGVRLIAPNRPGIHGSALQPERSLLDWPPVMAALADSLGLDRFRLIGLSGGGPYALACAWALGRRVVATATVCGALPCAPGPGRRHLSPVYRGMLAMHDHTPPLLKGALIPLSLMGRIKPPRAVLWLALKTLGPRDRAALWPKENMAKYFPAFQNSMRSGMPGLWEDAKPYSTPWPFALAEIRSPLTIWHGTQDTNFSCRGAAALAAGIPHAKYVETEEGHYSILPNQAGPVLDDLMK